MTDINNEKTQLQTVEELREENNKLCARIDELMEEREHLESELSMAAKLKYHLMPNIYPAFPDLSEVDIFADSINIEEIGGDFYDFVRIDSDHIGIVLADIFDGGTAAALYMVAFKIYLNSQLSMDITLESKIETVNDLLCWKNADNLCLSAWFGLYEISTGTLKAVNAGHESVVIFDGEKADICEKEVVSYLLGIIDGMKYQSYEIKLNPGDKLLIYTDGVTDSVNSDGVPYGIERLKSCLETTSGKNCEETVGILERDFSEFAKGSRLTEDASFLCLQRIGGDKR
jgi:sigma-B regulation protein RsbU (phosphoserine phosphatase)